MESSLCPARCPLQAWREPGRGEDAGIIRVGSPLFSISPDWVSPSEPEALEWPDPVGRPVLTMQVRFEGNEIFLGKGGWREKGNPSLKKKKK